MSAEALSEGGSAQARRPFWRDPFVAAFALGAIALTILPFVQRLSLEAPPPLGALGAFSLTDARGAAVDADTQRGTVWLVGFAPERCDAECKDALAFLARSEEHVRDLGDKVSVVTIARGADRPAGALGGDSEALWSRFSAAWDAQTQALSGRSITFMARPTFAVVDQAGAIRGFWPADDEGRGHAINAARMFAKHGTEP